MWLTWVYVHYLHIFYYYSIGHPFYGIEIIFNKERPENKIRFFLLLKSKLNGKALIGTLPLAILENYG